MAEEISKLKLKKIPVSELSKEDKEFMEKHPASRPPAFDIDDKQMPEIAEWEQGDKLRFVIDVNLKRKDSDEQGINGELEVLAYKLIKKKSIDEMDDKEFGKEQGEKLEEISKKK